MDHKRDIKTLVGFFVVSITIGVGIGSAKTHVYAAIADYETFKKEVIARLDVIEGGRIEIDSSVKDEQIAKLTNRLKWFTGN